jgi:parallel beta-helix repeat protein
VTTGNRVILGTRRIGPVRGRLWLAVVFAAALAVFAASCTRHPDVSAPATAPAAAPTRSAPVHAARHVCGQRILRSPFDYHGAAGDYPSGRAGLPTFGRPHSDFPADTRGVVLGAGTRSYASYQLTPRTVYYLLPGTHVGSFMADSGDAFVGGYYRGRGAILSGSYLASQGWAIDSNSSAGNQSGVTVEYLTIEKYEPNANSAAVNPDSNTGWTVRYNLITLNVQGAGVILGSGNVLDDNCLTLNGQYGFQSEDTNSWGQDSLTGGPYGITVTGNEISYNDTCDYEGLLDNSAIGWHNYDPVPRAYRSRHCGPVSPDGDEGGFKLWQTNGVIIKGNYIHGNWGPGAWIDTDNANTMIADNTFASNEGQAIFEEISYNFSITGNYMADNGWADGLSNPDFPTSAIYISESGSDRAFGSVTNCAGHRCYVPASYRNESVISGNTLVDNGGSVFLWQDSNRYCSDGNDGICTLVSGGPAGPFTLAACKAHLPAAAVNPATHTGATTGTPAEDWWDGCLWRTENVLVTHNVIDFDPAKIPDCNTTDWPDCGGGGIFAEYGSPPDKSPDWVIPTQLTFFSGDVWSDNTYDGPSTFFAWNQGNGDNPVSWADWTSKVSQGDDCTSSADQQSGYCTGPFGQDAGSTYHP